MKNNNVMFNLMTTHLHLCLSAVAQAQLSSLPPLKVPKRLIVKKQSEEQQGGEGTEKEAAPTENQTDQEKSVLKRTAALIQVGLVHVCTHW